MRPLILCVDDSIVMVRWLTRMLEELDAEVIGVTSADQGLAVMLGRDVAVVVADYEMPEMDGVEFLAQVRQIQPETTRILLTGHSSVETALAGVNRGEVFRFLTKPIEPVALRHAIDAALVQHQEARLLEEAKRRRERSARLRAAIVEENPDLLSVPRDDAGRYRPGPALSPERCEGLAAIAVLAQR